MFESSVAGRTRWVRRFLLAAMACSALVQAAVSEANTAAELRAKYAALGEQLRNNPFQRALTLESRETTNEIKGDIYAVVEHPFATVRTALDSPQNWCDILILHINTKYCRASTDASATTIAMVIGKKYDQPIEDAYRVDFAYRVGASTADFLEVRLNAENGPMGTSNYRILLEAAPLEDGRTFLHFTYSYAFGTAARMAMQVYLATIGSGKVGFTATGRQPNGEPDYIRGMRGVVERNTMRYYLAIDAYLGALSASPREQVEKRLQAWFDATEKYPRQLREVERTAYMTMKRSDYQRQQAKAR